MSTFKYRDKRTKKIVEFEWNEPRRPTIEEIRLHSKKNIRRSSGSPTPKVPYSPTVARGGQEAPNVFGVELPDAVPSIRGVTTPALPDIPEDRGDALSNFVYRNIARPSSSVLGLAADYAGGKVLGGVNKVLGNPAGKLANVVARKASPYFKKAPFTVAEPTGEAGARQVVTTRVDDVPQVGPVATPQNKILQTRNARHVDSDPMPRRIIAATDARPPGAAPNVRIKPRTTQQTATPQATAAPTVTSPVRDMGKAQEIVTEHLKRNPTMRGREANREQIRAIAAEFGYDITDDEVKRLARRGSRPIGAAPTVNIPQPRMASAANTKINSGLGGPPRPPRPPRTTPPPPVNPPPPGGIPPQPPQPPNLPSGAKRFRDLSAKEMAGEAWNTPKAVMSSADLSAPFRQNIPMVGKKAFWKSFAPMVKSLRGEGYDKVMRNISQNPDYELGIKSGLQITDVRGKASAREDMFPSSIAERVPIVRTGIKASNQAFTAFSNKVRMDVYHQMADKARKAGLNVSEGSEIAQNLAKFINDATGRGDLGKLEKHADLFNKAFFSTRNIAAKVNLMNPKKYVDMDPFTRKEALKTMLSFGTIATMAAGLAKSAGARVETDPRSTDFAKIRIGNTRVDIGGGFQQYIRTAAQLASGEVKNTEGNIVELGGARGQKSRYDVAESFVTNKLAPIPSLIVTMFKDANFEGDKPDLSEEVISRFTPMIIQDYKELAKEDPDLLPLIGLNALGMGTQTYGDRPPRSEKAKRLAKRQVERAKRKRELRRNQKQTRPSVRVPN